MKAHVLLVLILMATTVSAFDMQSIFGSETMQSIKSWSYQVSTIPYFIIAIMAFSVFWMLLWLIFQQYTGRGALVWMIIFIPMMLSWVVGMVMWASQK